MMRLLVLVCGLLLAALHPSLAQTTFTSGDCNSNITITNGGLTVSAPANNGTFSSYVCRAGNPKFSGKWYYTYTPVTINHPIRIGVSSGPTVTGGLKVQQCLDFMHAPQVPNVCGESSSIVSGDGIVTFNEQNFGWAATGSSTVGVVSAVVVDLDTDTPQYWFTPNANGTSGFGGGPLWNGDVTSTPTITGSGIPTNICHNQFSAYGSPTGCGTGVVFVLVGQIAFPMAALEDSSVTFNFGSFAPFASSLPGYSSWNTSGGLPTPNPLSPLNVQISNAPGWTSGTRAAGYRANAGPAWNGTAYTSGAKLCLFAVVTGGTTGSDPSVFNTACNSGTPAGHGGVPSGTWAGATTVTDGSVTWALLTTVDNISISAAAADTTTPWAQSAHYVDGSYVINGGRVYVQHNPSGGVPCDSASSGTGPNSTSVQASVQMDNTCGWSFRANIVYSSHNAMIPHQVAYTQSDTDAEIGIYFDINLNLWWGGTGATTYWAGHGNENDPITIWDINDYYGEWSVGCYHGRRNSVGSVEIAALNYMSCNGRGWVTTISPAPGDSFVDNAPTGPLGYGNPLVGVEIYSDSALDASGTLPKGPALLVDVNWLSFIGMQIHAEHGAAIGGNADYFTDKFFGHVNEMELQRNILYAGGGTGTVTMDANDFTVNNVIIYNGTGPTCYGLWNKFESYFAYNTFIGPGLGVAQCAAIVDSNSIFWTTIPAQRYNNAIFGFAVPWLTNASMGPSGPAGQLGGNNITDVPASYVTSQFSAYDGATYNGHQLHGTILNSASAAATFVNPTMGSSLDLRVKDSSSPLYGAGANFTYNAIYPINYLDFLAFPPTDDVYALARPTGSRFDVGAQQFDGAAGPITLNSVNLSSSVFTYSAVAGTIIGSVTVSTTGGSFGGTLSITGTNSGGFALSSSTLPSNLTCSTSTTCPASGGPFSDLSIVATQSGATGSPLSQAETITGSSLPTATVLRLNWLGRR